MGHRLSKPELATDVVFSIMSACWSPDRPTFHSLDMNFELLAADPVSPSKTPQLETIPNVGRTQGYTFVTALSRSATAVPPSHSEATVLITETQADEIVLPDAHGEEDDLPVGADQAVDAWTETEI